MSIVRAAAGNRTPLDRNRVTLARDGWYFDFEDA